MTDRGIAKLLDYLRRETPPGPDLLPDGELLARYVASRDEAAFELLVRRHGPMVLGTARRVLRDHHAAEDVVQAAFLALARKANSLKRGGAVAGWLHRVTLRAALRVRSGQNRVLARLSDSGNEISAWELTELRAVLDEEVARLPDRFRDAVVHCYLGGRTTDEAAHALRCPRGTVLSRLAAARKRLQARLTRRGYGLPAAGVAALWGAESAPALSPTLISLAVRAAGPAAAIAPGIMKLTEGVLHAMLTTKLKVATAFVLAAGFVGVGIGTLGAGPPEKKEQPAAEAKGVSSAEPRDYVISERERNEATEKRLRDAMTVASHKRIEMRLRIEDSKEQIEDLRRQREPLLKQIDTFETRLLNQELTLAFEVGADGKKDTTTNELREAVESGRRFVASLRRKDSEFRAKLTDYRRDLLRAEEELTLYEQLTQLETDKLRQLLQQWGVLPR